MKIRYGILIAFIFCFTSENSFACSNFDLQATQTGLQSYNPNSVSPSLIQIELNLLNGLNDMSCLSEKVRIVSGTATGIRNFKNGTNQLRGLTPSNSSPLATYTETGIELTENAISQLVATGALVFEYVLLPASEFSPAGTYTNLLNIQVDGKISTSFQTEVIVEPAMRLLGDVAGGQGTLDFGVVKDNSEVSSVFVYQSNTSLDVSAKSDNMGELVHERGSAYGGIPYVVYINNIQLSPNGNQIQALNSNVGERSLGTINVKVPHVGNPSAGHYSDILTLSFSAS